MSDVWKDLTKKIFGEFLANHRKKKKLSIRKLSAIAGISASYLSYIERGIHGPPSMKVTKELAKALEANEDEFLAKAGYVSREVSEAFEKNPKEISGAFRRSSSDTNFGLILAFAFIMLALSSDSDKNSNTDESEELPEPEEAYNQLKKTFITDDISIKDEREFFDYCSSIFSCWKSDLEEKEKGK